MKMKWAAVASYVFLSLAGCGQSAVATKTDVAQKIVTPTAIWATEDVDSEADSLETPIQPIPDFLDDEKPTESAVAEIQSIPETNR